MYKEAKGQERILFGCGPTVQPNVKQVYGNIVFKMNQDIVTFKIHCNYRSTAIVQKLECIVTSSIYLLTVAMLRDSRSRVQTREDVDLTLYVDIQ